MNEDLFKKILGKYKPANDNQENKDNQKQEIHNKEKVSLSFSNVKEVGNIIIGDNITIGEVSNKKETP